VHFIKSFPKASSTVFDGTKHAEHASFRSAVSRTEINGSRRNKRDPPGTDSVAIKPLPKD